MTSPTFQELFARTPIVRAEAPGRVNLMGDHTDYNDGFVLPGAIPQATVVEIAPRPDRQVRIWSESFPGTGVVEYSLGGEIRCDDWVDFVRGMTSILLTRPGDAGFDLRIASTVPLGSGLSSSASLEVAVGRALRSVFELDLSDVELARAGRRAENEFVGAPVGIMDQMACTFASGREALFLDTRSLDFRRVALPSSCDLFVIHCGVTHRHAGGGYVVRRKECDDAAATLGVRTLREIQDDDLGPVLSRLPEPLVRRVRHVVTENRRVLDTVSALDAGDIAAVGQLFDASHRSLRDDFEVSIDEMDCLVGIARRTPGVYGARLTGGGFGGSMVGMCEPSRAVTIARAVRDEYRARTGQTATVIVPPPGEA